MNTGAATPAGSGTIRVPEDAATLSRAIGQASPGDTIVLAAGTYPGGVLVPPEKHDLTIRGVDRTTVVLDGAARRKNGIVATPTACPPQPLCTRLHEERARLGRATGPARRTSRSGTSVNTASTSRTASAAAWITRTCPAPLGRRTTSASVGRERRRSPTSSPGCPPSATRNERDGRLDLRLDLGSQRAGIVPNTYANEALPPQERATILRNRVVNSGRARVPIRTALAGFVGIGIAIAGGNENGSRAIV